VRVISVFLVNLTRCFLAMVAELLPDKEQPFFFALAHEYRKFVENKIYWSVVTFGG
jgi:hypothetical protein